ncbi:MAG: amidohydrolase [Prolixibacteraceae bacterium]|nr:amidohydrolase [Prolixibacteraceae bacterium]
MTIDGLMHACEYDNRKHSILNQILKNKNDQVVIIPDYNTAKPGKPLPIKPERLPAKDLLKKYTKKISKRAHYKRMQKMLDEKNRFIINLSKEFSDRIIPLIGVNTNSKSFLRDTQNLVNSNNLPGIHLPNHLNKTDLITPDMYDFFLWAASINLIIIIHLNPENDIYSIKKVVRDFPGITFIIQHMIGVEKLETHLSKAPNLYIDLSPLHAISDERLSRTIEIFSPRSMLYGSAFPYGKDTINNNRKRLEKLVKNYADVDLIMGENWRNIINQQKLNSTNIEVSYSTNMVG